MTSRIAALLAVAAALLAAPAARAEGPEIKRLTWAGIQIKTDNTTVLIDAMATDIWSGNAPQRFVAPDPGDGHRRYALITHIHNDHFDAAGLGAVLGERGSVICHEDSAAYVASRGLRVIPARLWEPVRRGDFLFTAVPASDGFGDLQVSWIVQVGNKRFFHGGDTLWHGRLADIGEQFGPFTAAFVPINAARVQQQPLPSTPAVMTPLQASDAALLLRARTAVPIHYGFNDPPYYVEPANVLDDFVKHARGKGVPVQVLLPGEVLNP